MYEFRCSRCPLPHPLSGVRLVRFARSWTIWTGLSSMNGISFELVKFAFFWGVVGVDELVSSKFRDEHTVTKWGFRNSQTKIAKFTRQWHRIGNGHCAIAAATS